MMLKPMSKKELAEAAGYTYRQLYNIDQSLPEDKKLFVHASDGKYDLQTFVKRWVDFNVARESVDAEDLDQVRARHEIIKTQKTELEVARLRGQLIDVNDVKRLWAEVANAVVQNFLHLPNKIAPLLVMMDNAEMIAGIIDEEVRRVLENVAETPLPGFVSEDSEEDETEDVSIEDAGGIHVQDVPAAEETDGIGMG